ncbi:ribonuclease-like [Carettochelys insculpta]|uniref:ribonuclease-like n=1 Tax=Carettochelys insculpta TaxID=44489 RepID=UPI003EBA44EF
MAAPGPRPALLLVALLVALLAWPAEAQRETRHEKFLRQHVDFPQTRAPDARRYCNLLMARRNLTAPACKPTNTFLHAPAAAVDAVCGAGGSPSTENFHDSTAAFLLTVCRLDGGRPSPPCSYRGRVTTQRVRLACIRGVPVHFKGQL